MEVERLSTHGGSLRLYVRHASESAPPAATVSALRIEEKEAGLDGGEVYTDFGERVRALKRALLTLLIRLKSERKRIVGYGAPAKGNTLLNYCGIGSDFLSFTVDRNVHKQGLLLPGTHIPIRPPDAIYEEKPELVLILPWNLRDEIMSQLTIQDWGGRYIVPLPQPAIVDAM